LLDESFVDEVIRVEERDTIRTCHRLARRGFLFGGSTGTVVSGASDWLAGHDARGLTAVAVAPDLGERYLDTLYQTHGLQDLYGAHVLNPEYDSEYAEHTENAESTETVNSVPTGSDSPETVKSVPRVTDRRRRS